MCTVLDGYGVMTALNLEWRVRVIKINGTFIINDYNT
jgi:hypothetical protein